MAREHKPFINKPGWLAGLEHLVFWSYPAQTHIHTHTHISFLPLISNGLLKVEWC